MNKHLQKAMAKQNRTDLEVAIDHCRDHIMNKLIVLAKKRTDVVALMDDIDHLCNLRVVLSVDKGSGNTKGAMKDLMLV